MRCAPAPVSARAQRRGAVVTERHAQRTAVTRWGTLVLTLQCLLGRRAATHRTRTATTLTPATGRERARPTTRRTVPRARLTPTTARPTCAVEGSARTRTSLWGRRAATRSAERRAGQTRGTGREPDRPKKRTTGPAVPLEVTKR